MHGDKDTFRLAFALADKVSEYNQIRSGPQLALAPFKRSEGLVYALAGFVQPDSTNATAFYHRVQPGAKLNPGHPHVLHPAFVTTPTTHSWRFPANSSWFEVEPAGGGGAWHFPAASVNVKAAEECCSPAFTPAKEHADSSNQDVSYYTSCSCPPSSSSEDHVMQAIPISYFPDLRNVFSVSHNIFLSYQHDLWQFDQASSP